MPLHLVQADFAADPQLCIGYNDARPRILHPIGADLEIGVIGSRDSGKTLLFSLLHKRVRNVHGVLDNMQFGVQKQCCPGRTVRLAGKSVRVRALVEIQPSI